jgi:sulfotransferase
MKQLFFLSGIARSGSTLLGSILNQNPDIYVTPTSPLMDIFCLTEEIYNKMETQYTFNKGATLRNLQNSLADNFYDNINKPIIIDKHRGWPRNVKQIEQHITTNPKIICTYRPVAENICSFLKLIDNDPNNSVDRELRVLGLPCDTYHRALKLWYNYSNDPYESLKYGLEHYRKNILIVNYDDIIDDIENQMHRIYNFLEIPEYKHSYTTISNTCGEQKDDAWGFKNLHEIRNTITKTSNDPTKILGKDLLEFFNKFDNELMLID